MLEFLQVEHLEQPALCYFLEQTTVRKLNFSASQETATH